MIAIVVATIFPVFYSSFWRQLILAVDATIKYICPIQSHAITTTIGDTVRLTKARACALLLSFTSVFSLVLVKGSSRNMRDYFYMKKKRGVIVQRGYVF